MCLIDSKHTHMNTTKYNGSKWTKCSTIQRRANPLRKLKSTALNNRNVMHHEDMMRILLKALSCGGGSD